MSVLPRYANALLVFFQFTESWHVAGICRAPPRQLRPQVTCHCTHVQRVPRAVKSLRHSSASSAPLARRLGFHVIHCTTMDCCASVARCGARFSRTGYGDRGRTGSAPHDLPCLLNRGAERTSAQFSPAPPITFFFAAPPPQHTVPQRPP